MDFSGVNYVAVMLAAAASFVFGGIWYGVFSQQWMEAAGMTAEDIKPSGGPVLSPYINAFLAELVMAFMLAGVLGTLGGGHMNVKTGLITGAMMWLGFIMSSLVVNHSFQGAKKTLTLIDGGHWLGVLLVQGALIGWMGAH
jgi:hypothetical protein